MAGFGLAQLASRAPVGAAYRLSRARRLLIGAALLTAATNLGFVVTRDWALVISLVALNGVAFGVATTALLALSIDVRGENQKAVSVMAWYSAAVAAGFTAGPILAGFIGGRFGFAAAFGLVSAVALLSGLVIVPMRLGSVDRRERPSKPRPAGRWAAFRTSASAPILLATLVGFYCNFLTDAVNVFFAIFAADIGIAIGTIGFLRGVHSSAATVIRFFSAPIFRAVSYRSVNRVCIVVMALVPFLLPFNSWIPVLTLLFATLGTARGLVRVTSSAMLTEDHEASPGFASSLYNAGLDLGSLLGPPTAGLVAQAIGIGPMFQAMALGLPALYFMLTILIMRRARQPLPRIQSEARA
jgi:predicted MFS family arabinose efflux permease